MERNLRFSLLWAVLVCAGTCEGQVNSGLSSFSAYDSHAVDTINLQNLSIVVNTPVMSKPGAFPLSLGLQADSFVYQTSGKWSPGILANINPFTAVISGQLMTNGGGAYATFTTTATATCPNGKITEKYSGWYVKTADGTIHWLPSSDFYDEYSCFQSSFIDQVVDGTGYTLNATPGFGTNWSGIYDKSGMLVGVDGVAPLTDSNGNTLSVSNGVVTDTLGTSALTISGSTYSWTDVNSGAPEVSTTNSTVTLASAFGCSGVTDYSLSNRIMPTLFSFPDNTSFGVVYEDTPGHTGQYTGRIKQLTLRTGGTISYSYPGNNNGINCTYQVPNQLTRVTSDGTTTYTWAAVNNGNGNWGNFTTVVDNGGNTTIYTFTGLTASGNATFPITQPLTVVRHYQGASTLLSTDIYCYNGATGQPGNCATAVVSLPITEMDVYHTISGMSTSSRAQTKYDRYGNIIYLAQYDFGATTPTLTVATTYGSWNGSACVPIAAYVNDKPCDILTTQNGSNRSEERFAYDSHGNVLTTYKWTGSTWLSNPTPNSYNVNGMIANSYDFVGNVTSYLYNGTGGCNNLFPTSITSGSLTTSKTWNCVGGKLLTTTDANGATTTLGYANSTGAADPFWRINSVTDPLGNTKFTTFAATSVNDSFSFNSSIQSATGTTDSYGRPINHQRQEGPSSPIYDTVTSSYAWSGNYRQTFSSVPCAVPFGSTCATGTTTLLDPLGRVYTVTDADGATITKAYAQNDILTTLSPAPAGEHNKSTQKEYDGLGRTVKVCQILASGGTSCGQNTGTSGGYVTTYSYTAFTGGTQVQSARGSQTRTKLYDSLGRLTQDSEPESGAKYLYYDVQASCAGSVAGHLTRTVDANGNSICYYYDSLGRLTTVNANGTTCRHFYYDNSPGYSGTIPAGITIANQYGRMVEAATDQCSSGTLQTDLWFSYDKNGRATDQWESTPHSGQYYHSIATFFANSMISTLQLASPSIYTLTYGIDGEGRWDTLREGASQTIVTGPASMYNAAGEATEIDLTGSGPDKDLYTYDLAGRMKTFQFNVGSSNLSGTLNWNNNGSLNNLAVIDGFNSGGTQTCDFNPSPSSGMGYDDLGRLVNVSCGTNGSIWNQTFSYDQYDNITKSSPGPGINWNPGYSSSTNHYTLAGASYDSNGNLLNDTFHIYEWNEFSKMKSVDRNGAGCATGGECVIYDALGRAVEVDKGATKTEIWYTQLGKGVYMNGSTISYAYWPTPGGGTVTIVGNVGAMYYEHKDWLGNARIASTINGHTVYTDQAYAPYGEIYDQFGSTDLRNQIFAGDTQDTVAGTMDTPNREYNSSAQGRWISPDPAGDGWNLYAYATNPLSSVDPSGLFRIGPSYFLYNGGSGGIAATLEGGDWFDPLNGLSALASYSLWVSGLCIENCVAADSSSSSSSPTPPQLCGCPNDMTSGILGSSPSPQEQAAINSVLSDATTDTTAPLWELNPDAQAGCSGPGIPCTVSQAPYAPVFPNGVTSASPFSSGANSLLYTIDDVNGRVVNNVTQVNEYFSDVVPSDSSLKAGTWSSGGFPLNYGNVANGQFIDNIQGNFSAIQSFSATVGGVNYVISSQFSMNGGFGGPGFSNPYHP